jgi:YVTN family beta-propeller protein
MIRALTLAALLLVAVGSNAGNSSAKGGRLILATYWGDDKVALIDLEGEPGKEEIWTLDTLKAVGCAKPYDVRASKKGDEAWVSCSGTNQIALIDIVAQQVKATVRTGSSPRDLVYFDNDTKLIVANSGDDTVSIVDAVKRIKIYDFSVSSQPYGVAVSADGKTAMITGWASGDLHIARLGPTSATVLGKVDIGLLPYTVVAPGDGKTAYVAAAGSHIVATVDVEKVSLISRTRVGRNPWSLAASPLGDQILVTNNRSNNLSLLKTGQSPAAASDSQPMISAGAQALANGDEVKRAAKNASIAADGKSAVFTDLANNQIVLLDLPSRTIRKVINVGKAPYGIEYIR